MMGLEALMTNLTQKGLQDSQKLWPTVTLTLRSQVSTKTVVKTEELSESDLEVSLSLIRNIFLNPPSASSFPNLRILVLRSAEYANSESLPTLLTALLVLI
uniref:Uncharacterized protein n=1 Tax=Quercus lobata TaxID=97700 RepID=A0A7N2MFI8_QUELO